MPSPARPQNSVDSHLEARLFPLWFYPLGLLCFLILVAPLLLWDRVGLGSVDAGIYFRNHEAFFRGLQHGTVLPYWMDQANAGFGSYELMLPGPLPYYFLSSVTVILGGQTWLGFKFGFLLAFVLGGWGVYRLARRFVSPRLSLAAAALYILGPYSSFQGLGTFGMSETMGIALCSWMIDRLWMFLESPSLKRWVGFILFFSVLILTHLPTAFATGGLILALTWSHSWMAHRSVKRLVTRTLVVLLGVGVALGQTIFFWGFLVFGDSGRDIRGFIADWSPQYIKYIFTSGSWMIPDVAIPLLYGIIGGLGLCVVLFRVFRSQIGESQRRVWAGLLLALAGGLAIQTIFAKPIWETLKLSSIVDRTYRFDGVLQLTSTLLLVLAARVWMTGCSLTRQRWAVGVPWMIAGAQVGLAIAISWYLTGSSGRTFQDAPAKTPESKDAYPFYHPATAHLDRVMEREQTTDWRVRGNGLEQIDFRAWSPQFKQFVVNGDAMALDVRQFDFERWRLWVDGQPYPKHPGEPFGQIQFDVPAGRHEVTLQFMSFDSRNRRDVTSLILFAATIFLLFLSFFRSSTGPFDPARPSHRCLMPQTHPHEKAFRYRRGGTT